MRSSGLKCWRGDGAGLALFKSVCNVTAWRCQQVAMVGREHPQATSLLSLAKFRFH